MIVSKVFDVHADTECLADVLEGSQDYVSIALEEYVDKDGVYKYNMVYASKTFLNAYFDQHKSVLNSDFINTTSDYADWEKGYEVLVNPLLRLCTEDNRLLYTMELVRYFEVLFGMEATDA